MESINISKTDLKYLLLLVALAPVVSFTAGAVFSLLFRSNPATPPPFPVAHPVTHNFQVSGSELKYPEPEETLKEDASLTKILDEGFVERTTYSKQYVVQAGVFSNRENARSLVAELRESSLVAQILRDTKQNATLYRVILAAFASAERAQAYSEKIKSSHNMALYMTPADSSAPLHNLAAL